ncbi:hypothetical protein [Methylobacterium sp. J-076]|uniref:hypothetical protein n=1 Tax=Methylobacterium sp. J-076 TaxID=2836655 RepID=UPI001FB9222C|nr:hypothetical protein [Methylobacterium sp. J-076]MCJ2013636.1 hypothetical protein [Methylobacterium sp. J-076]
MSKLPSTAEEAILWIANVLMVIEENAYGLPAVSETVDERLSWLSAVYAGRRILNTTSNLMRSDPDSARALLLDVAQLIDSLGEGARYIVDAELDVMSPTVQAAKAREVRAERRNNNPEVRAFHEALADELVGKTPEQIGSRDFVGITWKAVNRSLEKLGFKPVSAHAVRRRLKYLRS